jgi:hypothetical protein
MAGLPASGCYDNCIKVGDVTAGKELRTSQPQAKATGSLSPLQSVHRNSDCAS